MPGEGTASIGPERGTIALGDTSLVVPQGALSETVEIGPTINDSPEFQALRGLDVDVVSPRYLLSPPGLTLDVPVTLATAVDTTAEGEFFGLWTDAAGVDELLEATIEDGGATLGITHLCFVSFIKTRNTPTEPGNAATECLTIPKARGKSATARIWTLGAVSPRCPPPLPSRPLP